MFTNAALFKQVKGRNNPNIQVLNEETKYGIHTMGYYAAIKRDEVCWCMLSHGWTLKTLSQEASQKRQHITWCHLYEIFITGDSTETNYFSGNVKLRRNGKSVGW